jgi:hypothetical protein
LQSGDVGCASEKDGRRKKLERSGSNIPNKLAVPESISPRCTLFWHKVPEGWRQNEDQEHIIGPIKQIAINP